MILQCSKVMFWRPTNEICYPRKDITDAALALPKLAVHLWISLFSKANLLGRQGVHGKSKVAQSKHLSLDFCKCLMFSVDGRKANVHDNLLEKVY